MNIDNKSPLVIISTATSHKMGFGHVSRSMMLQKLLKDYGVNAKVLITSDAPELPEWLKQRKLTALIIQSKTEEYDILKKYENQLKILFVDKRDTDLKIYQAFEKTFLIAIDNLGKDRNYFDLTYSPLPYYDKVMDNFTGSEYLFFPKSIFSFKKSFMKTQARRILISFGGTDPHNLSDSLLDIFKDMSFYSSLTLVLGPLYKGKLLNFNPEEFPSNISILKNQSQLKMYQLMQEHDLLITSFGITSFEALMINIPTFLVNQSHYNQKITQTTSFPHASLTGEDKKKKLWAERIRQDFEEFLKNPLIAQEKIPKNNRQHIVDITTTLLQNQVASCPLCNKTHQQIVFRNASYNILYCKEDNFYYTWTLPFLMIENPLKTPLEDIHKNWEDHVVSLLDKIFTEISLKKGKKLNPLHIYSSLDQKIKYPHFRLLENPAFSSFYKNTSYKNEKLLSHFVSINDQFSVTLMADQLSSIRMPYPFYDIVLSFHTLYKKNYLTKLLEKSSRLLSQEGYLIFNMMLYEKKFQTLKNQDLYKNYESPYLFSLKSLKTFLAKYQFNIINSIKIPQNISSQKDSTLFLDEYLIITQKTNLPS